MDDEVYLVLGCFGLTEDGFVSCSACENNILKVTPSLGCYNDIMDYMDTCRLFDKPTFNFNTIRNIIQNIQYKFDFTAAGKPIWSEKDLKKIEKFVVNHRFCGLYLKLKVGYEGQSKVEDKPIEIESSSNKVISTPKFKLKLVRGKR